MPTFHRLKITSDAVGTAIGTMVEVDGVELHGIRSIKLSADLDHAWSCVIEFIPGALDVEVVLEPQSSEPPVSNVIRMTDQYGKPIFDIGESL